jgi:hypothetical protein
MKVTKTHVIKSILNLSRYSMEDFWAVCPHDVDQIKSRSRLGPIRSWRQVGMVWARLCGHTLDDSGEMFGGKDHATVLHSERAILNVLEGYGDPLVGEAINEIVEHTLRFIMRHEDMNVNEAACVVLLDDLMGSKLANIQNK